MGRPTECSHKIIVLIGNDETGLRSAHCAHCGWEMTRRIVGTQYEYREVQLRRQVMKDTLR